MANAPDFAAAAGSLSASEYTIGQTAGDAEVEAMLRERRTAVREQFDGWVADNDPEIVTLFRSRDDYANLRLAVRRAVTDRPVGSDYSPEGNVPPELYEQVFEKENYELFPDYLRRATEEAVLAYYQNKEIPQIDHTIDRLQAAYKLSTAEELEKPFLLNLFRIEVDLTNLRTLLRLKLTDADQRNVFLEGGFIELERFAHGLDAGYEAFGQLFFVTPYNRVAEIGAGYVASDESFLKLEQQCEEYLTGYLRTAVQVTAGLQPLVAYLLLKEQEIRTVRLILTAKRNQLDARLILDRIGA
jgi:V/A-type H+-transporting ATPase subunit C